MPQAPPRSARWENPPRSTTTPRPAQSAAPHPTQAATGPSNVVIAAYCFVIAACLIAVIAGMPRFKTGKFAVSWAGLIDVALVVAAIILTLRQPPAGYIPVVIIAVVFLGTAGYVVSGFERGAAKNEIARISEPVGQLMSLKKTEVIEKLFKMQEDVMRLTSDYHVTAALARGVSDHPDPAHTAFYEKKMAEQKWESVKKYRDDFDTPVRFLLLLLSQNEIAGDGELDMVLATGIDSTEHIDAVAAGLHRIINRISGSNG